MQSMTSRKRAFTLIELLIVVSIIAILIGILLPALGEARRNARITIDLASLREHGKGMAAYAAEQKGRMPNGPPGRGLRSASNGSGESVDSGPGNRPARVWAHDGFYEHNGVGFPIGLDGDDYYTLYHFAFGNYIVDGARGDQLLNEVFTSAGRAAGSNRGNFRAIRSTQRPEFIFPESYKPNRSRDPHNPVLETSEDTGEILGLVQPDFLYTPVAVYGSSADDSSQEFFSRDGVQTKTVIGTAQKTPWSQFSTWSSFAEYILQDRFAFPTRKIVFWPLFAHHNRSSRTYMDPNTDVPLALVDGSAQNITPFNVMPKSDQEIIRLQELGDSRGPISGAEWSQRSGIRAPCSEDCKAYAWFAFTIFGPEGRDLP